MTTTAPEAALAHIAKELRRLRRRFAVVGGLAVSVRAEVRFTRDVDIAVIVDDDRDAEALVLELRNAGYAPIATVEHETQKRLSTARLRSPFGVVVDLLTASSGIETEIVERASDVTLDLERFPVARAEELLAMKILSMDERRLQDRIDAANLIAMNPGLDIAAVRELLVRIRERGFDRGRDLTARLDDLLSAES